MPTSSIIFISYRRDDTQGDAGRIYDRMRERFGADAIFMDVDNIIGGQDFAEELRRTLSRSSVVLAVIGRRWTAPTPNGSNRLSDPNDFVRIELEAAFREKLKIFPVVVQGASVPTVAELPRSLHRLPDIQAVSLRHDSYDTDAAALVNLVQAHLSTLSATPRAETRTRPLRGPAFRFFFRTSPKLTVERGPLRVERLSQQYRAAGRSKTVLNDVTLTIEPGVMLAITGLGISASALLRIFALVESPIKGSVEIAGHNIMTCDLRDIDELRTRVVRYVSAVPDLFFRHDAAVATTSFVRSALMTAVERIYVNVGGAADADAMVSVKDHVAAPLFKYSSNSPTERSRRALKYLRHFGVASVAEERLGNLLPHVRQRVAFARAFVTEPLFVIIDRRSIPVAAGDQTHLFEQLRSLCHALGVTIIYNAWSNPLRNLADRFVRLADGRIATLGVKTGSDWAVASERSGDDDINSSTLDGSVGSSAPAREESDGGSQL